MTSNDKLNIDKLDIVIRHTDGQVVAGIPQIALYAKAENAVAALESLERKKNILKDDIAAAGVVDPVPYAATSVASPTDGIGRFVIKSGIVALMVLLVLAVSGGMLASRIEATARGIVGGDLRGGRQFWTNLEQGLERMADPSNEMSEERKQKLASSIRVLVNRVRPFTAELAPLFTPPPGR
jgi:hypothetical protein